MEAAEIIEYLRDRDLIITLSDGDSLELSPVEKITHELIKRLRKHKPAIIEELKREQRREKVLRMLEENPGAQRTFVTDTESDRHNVILTIAIKDKYSFEMHIPKSKYDPFMQLELLEKGSLQ